MKLNDLIKELYKELEHWEPRSAWHKGVKKYAFELLEPWEECTEEIVCVSAFTKKLLNGANDWSEYSYNCNALIYDSDIAERLCSPSELKIKDNGRLSPNSYENWLDVQANALYQADYKLKCLTIKLLKEWYK